MKVVVTGAAGFIGSHLVEHLAESGFSVLAIDCLLEESYSANIKKERFDSISRRHGVQCLEFDLRKEIPKKLFEDGSVIINLAAMPGLMKSWQRSDLYFSCNVLVVSNLLHYSQSHGQIPILQISTSSVYGDYSPPNEEGELNPVSPYGISKMSAEKMLQAYSNSFGIPYCILRYHSIYGPRQRPDMAYHIICESILNGEEIKIFGDGTQIRPSTFVSDAVNATIRAIDFVKSNEIFNITGPENVSLIDAIQIIESSLGRKAKLRFEPARPGDQKKTMASFEKASRTFGYMPQIGVEEGLAAQVKWHRSLRK